MTKNNNIFARPTNNADEYAILYITDGYPVTRLPGCWPLHSELSGYYEHPEGILLDAEQVERLAIPIEV